MKILSSFTHPPLVWVSVFCWIQKTTFWRMLLTKQMTVAIDFHSIKKKKYSVATVTCLVIKILQNSFQNLHFEVNYLYNLHCFQGFQVTSNELAFSIKVSVLLDKLLHIYFKCHVVLRTSWGNNQMRSSKWSFLMFSVRKSDSFSVNRFILSSRSVYMSDLFKWISLC